MRLGLLVRRPFHRQGHRELYREIVFELVHGRAVTPLFQALSEEPAARGRLQASSMGPETVSVLIDYHGPAAAVARLRHVVETKPESTVLRYDALVDEPDHLRFVATWRRPLHPDEGVSLEHHLHDQVGAGALLFGRVQGGIIAYKAASPEGRGLPAFLAAVSAAFGERFTVRVIRSGPYRPGWEIDETSVSVRPEETALLLAAFSAGYYDEPRRCGVRELGDVLGVSKSVVARRLRTLERRALERMVSASPGTGTLAAAPLAPAPLGRAPERPSPPGIAPG